MIPCFMYLLAGHSAEIPGVHELNIMRTIKNIIPDYESKTILPLGNSHKFVYRNTTASACSGLTNFLFFDKKQLANLHPTRLNAKSSSKANPKSPYLRQHNKLSYLKTK